MSYLVLETSGKHEQVFTAKVLTFESLTEANRHVKEASTGRTKHWTTAEIVRPGDVVELGIPEV